jgi:hypothetical protein
VVFLRPCGDKKAYCEKDEKELIHDRLEFHSEGNRGDDVLFLNVVRHQAVIFVVEVQVQKEVFAQLRREAGRTGDDIIA